MPRKGTMFLVADEQSAPYRIAHKPLMHLRPC
jgi:hypothetical protein